jgi:hypothetical protein
MRGDAMTHGGDEQFRGPGRGTDRRPQPAEGRHPGTVGLLRHFEYAHLPPHLAALSRPVCELAHRMVDTLPDDPELTAGLRKLLEAKDCFVRVGVVVGAELTRSGPVSPHPGPDRPVGCLTCSGRVRETVGMVCQTCGTDYGLLEQRREVAQLDADGIPEQIRGGGVIELAEDDSLDDLDEPTDIDRDSW